MARESRFQSRNPTKATISRSLSTRDDTMTMAVDDIDRPSQEERDSHFKPGSIKRVKLTNFLTYDSVEFYPGSR